MILHHLRLGRWALGLVAASLLACPSKTSAPSGDAPDPVASDAPAPEAGPPAPWAGRDDLIRAPARAEPRALTVPPVERFRLANGLEVRLMREASLPLVELRLLLPASTDAETRELRGLARFVAGMLTQGTRTRSAEQIAERIDQVGGRLTASADDDGTQVTCRVLSKDVGACLELVPDVVLNPAFPEAELGQVRDQLLASVKQVRDMPQLLAREHLANLLWGEAHVRGWPMTAASVQAITRQHLVDWHAAAFKPNGSILFAAGDLEPVALRAALEKAFGAWPQGPLPPPRVYPEPRFQGLTIRLVDKPDLTQTQILVGHLGLARSDPDYLATRLFNYSLGAGAFSSRLMKVVRSEGGKTYGARSVFEAGRERGAFHASTFTRNAEAVATLKLVLGELAKMRAAGPTPGELEDARSNLAGNWPLKLESPLDRAAELLSAELHGLDRDFVRDFPLRVAAVELEEVKAAAARRLDPENAVVVLVSRAEELEPLLTAAGYRWERVGYLEPTSAEERRSARAALDTPLDPARSEEGQRLMALALEAKGGRDRLAAVRDILLKGSGQLSAQGQTFEVQVTGYFAVPDRKRVDIQLPMGTISSVVTADDAWGGMGAMTKDAPPETVAAERAQMWRHKDLVLLRHLEPGVQVAAREPVEEEGVRYEVVELRRADGLRALLWLEPETRMLARLVYELDGQPAEERYADYRAVDGLQMAFSQSTRSAKGRVDLKLGEIKVNAGLPPGIFERPAPPKP